MRSQLRDRLGEFIAAVAPAVDRVRDVAAVTIGVAEIVLSRIENSVQLVLRLVLRQPVALILGEIEYLRHRVEIQADDLAGTMSDHLRPAAIEIGAAKLSMRRWRHADVAGRADIEIELVVGPY